MEAIRKKNVKLDGRKLTIELPENFTAKEVDLIVWLCEEESFPKKQQDDLDIS